MLDMWAKCLKELGNLREYISIALRAVSCITTQPYSLPVSEWSLTELIESSADVIELIMVPLENYFLAWNLGPYISHFVDSDGFGLELHIRSLLNESFQADLVSIQIISVEEGQSDEICLTCGSNMTIKPGTNKISLISKVKVQDA